MASYKVVYDGGHFIDSFPVDTVQHGLAACFDILTEWKEAFSPLMVSKLSSSQFPILLLKRSGILCQIIPACTLPMILIPMNIGMLPLLIRICRQSDGYIMMTL